MSKLLMSKEEEYLGHKKRFKEEYGSWEKNEKLFHKPGFMQCVAMLLVGLSLWSTNTSVLMKPTIYFSVVQSHV